MQPKSVNILLVDDDDVDVMRVKRTFKELRIANPLHVANDGVEALEMLRGANGCSAIPEPHLVLLDLNMPRMNGIEFLKQVRDDPELDKTIIFVLTTSNADEDRTKAYKKHVAGYIVKAETGESLMTALGMVNSYWRVIEFP